MIWRYTMPNLPNVLTMQNLPNAFVHTYRLVLVLNAYQSESPIRVEHYDAGLVELLHPPRGSGIIAQVF
jgi:hypothetical protein